MKFTQSDLDTAKRHVSEGEIHILKQQRLIDSLRYLGATTELAEELLDRFQTTLQMHRQHRNLIATRLKSSKDRE